MYTRKRHSISQEHYMKRKMEATDEEDLEGEDEAEGSQCDFRQPPPFPCEHVRNDYRSFPPQYFNIGYPHNEFAPPYNQNVIQHHMPCGIGAISCPRGEPQPAFFQHHIIPNGNGEMEDFCTPNVKSEELERKLSRKVEIPLIFFGDSSPNGIDPCEVYCTVPGRTSLLSSTTKYRVTVGEIQRRISPPECLNASLLGGILRRAKSKDGGKTLRDSLRKIGLTLPAGRRKQANVTAWTALVEEEAVHMAKDFAVVCEKEFHAREIGIYLTKANISLDHDVMKRRTMLENSRKIVSELCDLLAADRTPLTPFIALARPAVTLDPSIQQHLSHYTLMTHGFGGVAMVAVLESVKSMIDESIKYLDRTCSQTMYIPYNTR
ncbi:unnamed protein product [Cylicocyclus nassatus]|uniref:Transcription factor AP-2 C-terminal domain-containing protein n=1 Tax=Cylicocyclus nassatus TaxID=53992 RepID=A0AA36DUD1_CYLNA|nr:unnamed protein product [Cylicocyclus nassatus]